MKLKKIAIAAALGAASSFATAGGFDGPFVQLGIGGSYTSVKTSNTESGNDVNLNGTASGGSFNGLVSAGYSLDMGAANNSLKGFNLAANLFYVIGNQKGGSPSSTGINTYTNGEVVSPATLSGNGKLKNTWGISVEPGWNFTEQTLGYLKLAWVNSTINPNVSYSDPNGSASFSQNANINGFGYGLGAKQLLTKNIYVGVDLMGVTYQTKTMFDGAQFKPSQFMGFASVGYKF